jgi:hypothetical protein
VKRADLGLFIAHVAIPFATGAGLGTFFVGAIYYLDVGGMRTMLAASGVGILEIGLIPIAFAFGALAIGTKQAMGFLIDT